ncbi:UxaA family hydrolase [Oleiharenicola lentus]|uniref:UxaA family hydrolase n=1 Tax=Oleiharenicola lentus TaxID=2508720 RepID=UPI003F67FE71
MSAPLPFAALGRLPAPGDNVAIAIRQIEAGTIVELPGGPQTIAHTILEGHRFSVRAIAAGEPLLSWGETFGHALTAIAPGSYICNQSILDWLVLRRLAVTIPSAPNFADHLVSFELDEATLHPAPPVPLLRDERTFNGYLRPGRRGVGTRNYIVILGTTSRTASFARQLTARLQALARIHPSLDGIVAIAHTEGGGPGEPHNATEVIRALAGFMVHPNVGAILAVDYGVEPITNSRLATYLREKNYPLAEVPHAFLSITNGLSAALVEGEKIVRGWLPTISAERRTPQPVAALRVALQCGGSDAFSGVSGNPLAGAMVHEVVRRGGIGVLCETDELSGAESYLMKNLRDAEIARALLMRIARFKARLDWHGVTPESNPSAGNKLRGLYNITLKSLGAVHKKDPRTRIDHVIDYADPLTAPGFYFMDSPGNDLEGIAGQVGAGCSLFLFVTGNGSITNFPFVPTLKLTTTTRRHQLLVHEMDINAGRYLDGESFEALTAESFESLIATASGQRTKGEHAGHSQSSLWRNWRQTDATQVAAIRARAAPDGKPLIASATSPTSAQLAPATERLGLVLPTSMCSAQIARLAADRMNANGLAAKLGYSRFLALTHSEGCGFGGESMYHLLYRTYRGYATHPNVGATLLLEHGCEKIPNDVMRRQFETANIPLDRFGWASVQLDGGIDRALAKIENWFTTGAASATPATTPPDDPLALTFGLVSASTLTSGSVAAVAALVEKILAAGGSVLLPESDPLLANSRFLSAVLGRTTPHATLAYGQPSTKPGFHIVQTDTDHWTENLAGLGACGAHLFLGLVADTPQQGHPMLPLIQIAESARLAASSAGDVDLVLTENADENHDALREIIASTVNGQTAPAATVGGFVDFQLSRGLLGVST